MKRILLLLVAAGALALAVPAAFAKGGDDGPGDDHGRDVPAQVAHGDDDPAGHDAGDDNGQNAGADDKGAHRGRHLQVTKKAKHRANGSGVPGTCTARSTSKMKVNAPRNGRIQVEFEVESHVVGQSWNVVLKDNGTPFFSGNATTKAPGGAFEIRAFAKDQTGTDLVTAQATNAASGETCSASASA